MSTVASLTETDPTPAVPHVERPVSREEVLRAWGKETDWLDAQWSAGAFAAYADEYIITADHVILSHGRNLDNAYIEAERKADELGIPHWRLVNYFCE
jgi:hypothetical protein